MADRDRLPNGLYRRYEKHYDQVAEWRLPASVIADAILPSVLKDVKKYGDAPIAFIAQVVERFESLRREPLFAPGWLELGQMIDALANQSSASRLPTECARHACKELAAELRAGEIPKDLFFSAAFKYLVQVYDARFAGSIPQTPHSNGTSYELMMARLAMTRPAILDHLEAVARQVNNKKSVAKLRLPPRHHKPAIESETDLEKLGV